MAKSNQVAIEMQKILSEYSMDVVRATNTAAKTVANEAANKLKNTSPKKTGKYARAWKVKTEKGSANIDKVVVYNKRYQLTHLLENGHVVRNKKGTYGRAPAQPHIAPVNEWAADELPREIERELK